MSNQETKQEQIQFSAQQELKHLRTRCGKVYALGNNRFRAVVQTTPVHEFDAATHQWVELSAEKRQQMAAQAHSPIATLADSANSAENTAGILDTYVKEGSQQNFSHDERLWISNTNYYGNRLTYLKVVDLPRLGANHFITSAKLCVRNVYAPTADTAIMCKEVLEGWDPETITYDHQPNVSGVYQDYCRVLKNQYSWKEFDVTSLARKWYLGENHGVQLSAPKSESSFSQLHSSETANQPYFVLEYVSLAGLESYLTYDHQSAGLAGTGSVSLVNGNLIFSHADTAMNGNRLPVSITHYYNSCDSDKDEFGMGYGWRTSLHQTLHKVLYNGEEEFVYTDGDGTEHFYKKNKDLSEEIKDKIRTQYKNCRNNTREMFVKDYEAWIKYEAKGALRLNKVTRRILYIYCPASVKYRANLEKQPAFTDAAAQYERDRQKKIKELKGFNSNVTKRGGTITKVLEDNLAFYEDM